MPLFHFRWATIYLFQTLLFQSSSQCLEIPVEVALREWVLTLTLCLAPRLTLAVRGIQHLSCKTSDSCRVPSFLPSICFVLCVLSSCPFGSTPVSVPSRASLLREPQQDSASTVWLSLLLRALATSPVHPSAALRPTFDLAHLAVLLMSLWPPRGRLAHNP